MEADRTGVSPWTHTDPGVGNRWCVLARNHRVLAFPIWLYCDDTSGNMSKKWNKHNSWLFSAAGLDGTAREQHTLPCDFKPCTSTGDAPWYR